MTTYIAKAGDIVVIYGRTRDVVKYTDAKNFVSYLRERDFPEGSVNSNEEYMRTVALRVKETYEDFNLPSHNEEAFIGALFRIGMFGKTTLN